MYIIVADGHLLHAPHLLNEGCGVLSPKLTVELNKAGSLEFTIPPNHVMYNASHALYNKFYKLKTVINVYHDDEEIFRGRVLHDEKDFNNLRQTYCEGELAFLLDSIQRPYSFDGTYEDLFKKYITNHNSRVDSFKKFSVGNITAENATKKVVIENSNHSKTMDALDENIVNAVGGYLKIRTSGDTRYLDWLKDSGENSTQVIEFGINLLDITEHITAEDIFTVLIPIGATLEDSNGNSKGKLDIKSVNDGKDYVENSTAISLFGRIENTAEWSEVTNAAKLKQLAEDLLKANIEMAVTLTLRAVDLNFIDVNYDKIRLGDWVQVISIPHGLNKLFQCTKIVYDLTSPDQTEYTFGVKFNSLTDKQVSKDKNIQSAINQATSAASKAENIIAQVPTGVISDESIDNIWNAQFNS